MIRVPRSSRSAKQVQTIAIAIGLIAFVSSQAEAQLTSYVFNTGSCSSQGAWTQSALDQANAISETVNNLANDPNCKGLANALGAAPPAQAQPQDEGDDVQQSYQAESVTGEVEALRTVLSKSPGQTSKILNPILAKTTLDSMTSAGAAGGAKNQAFNLMKSRYAAAAGRGLEMLNSMFTTLPNYKKCMQSRPDLAGALFVHGVRMAAAFAGGGQGITQKFSSTIGNFLNYLQDAKFAAIQKNLNKQKFWTELSCLVETTQASYCSVQDGFELLKSQKAQAASQFRGTPLEGYYIMSREVPEISTWIRKIQIGIEPRLTTDAQFKKDTWASMVRLYGSTYDLPAIYFENYNTVYKNLTSIEQKQNNIRQLLGRLQNTMTGGDDDSGRGSNFFVQAVNPTFIPFFLIGRDKLPKEVITAGANKIDPGDYFLDLERVPELKNPDDVMAKMIVRLRELMDKAMITGADYFRSRMSVDQVNLVDDAVTSNAISSRQSLINIHGYLEGLYKRLSGRSDSQTILPSILDTMSRIDRIQDRFEALEREARKLNLQVKNGGYSLGDLSNYDGARRNQMMDLFQSIVTSVYLEFNVLLQRDSFFSTRIGTYVKYDYFARARNEDFSKYTNQLLLTSGANIIDRMTEVQKFNIAAAESDLSSANVINMSNLEQLEDLVEDHMENYLLDLNKRSGHGFVQVMNPNFIQLWPKSVWFAAKQDRNNEAENTRAKVCIQTLGFKRYKRFLMLCHGAKLKATLTAADGRGMPLEFDYNTLYRQHFKDDNLVNQVLGSSLLPSSNRFSQVCTLRDYYRNNLVAWLTADFAKHR